MVLSLPLQLVFPDWTLIEAGANPIKNFIGVKLLTLFGKLESFINEHYILLRTEIF
jgi:hypothetical protein